MAKRARNAGKAAGGGKDTAGDSPVGDYRHHGVKRKNNPPAKIAAEGVVPVIPKVKYEYNPHLPPVLRFDQHGKPDVLPELLAKARREPLSDDEAHVLAEALRINEPWLEWTGKREKKWFEVDPVALHIHERVSAQAILKVAARQDVQRSLFADPQQEYHEAVQFYRHDVAWANRLILGDSLQVMSSLARREDLAGKVQMIYMDPPYGIRFASNFQPEVGKRDVRDKQEDLTREPEMVRAYRDTWHLGIHSYLSYLRDRLIVARELLADSGSIFVQISDENIHRVRAILDDVFGPANFCSLITVRKTAGASSPYAKTNVLSSVSDYLLWYAKSVDNVKYRQLHVEKELEIAGGTGMYQWLWRPQTGEMRRLASDERVADIDGSVVRLDNLTATGFISTCTFDLEFEGRSIEIPRRLHWKTNREGMRRLLGASRVAGSGTSLAYVRSFQDFGVFPLSNSWGDTASGGFTDEKVYVVQTNSKAVQRCMLMTTDPGDLVLDPTCGSGTTAYVAEQWGRRWITIDTSRVAISIARQRLLTTKYDMYRVKAPDDADRPDGHRDKGVAALADARVLETGVDPHTGFACKTVPHVTLKSIAQNVALDPIFARHEPILDKALAACNAALAKVTPETRKRLGEKLAAKQRNEGKKSITDADRRRWLLPPDNREDARREDAATQKRREKSRYTLPLDAPTWCHWEVPFDTDPDWPKGLAETVTAYRAAWRVKMDEVTAAISASAEQEELVDQPEQVRGITRVTGPFTVEAVQPPEMTLGENLDVHTSDQGGEGEAPAEPSAGLFAGEPESQPGGFEPRSLRVVEPLGELEVANVTAYLDTMLRYLRADGVRFLNNKQMKWTRLESLFESGRASGFHAEGRWVSLGEEDKDPQGQCNVAVIFGPQYGGVTAKMVEEAISAANRAGYDDLVVAGFSFDGAATGIVSETQGVVPGRGGRQLRVHFAHVRPDINPGMNGLLKESPQPGAGQLFTVFGLPRVSVRGPGKKGATGSVKDGDPPEAEYTVTMEGVDIYNPVTNEIASTGAAKVAAWFLDSDFDGRTFCITQAFFPDRGAWEKLARVLNGKDGPIDAERFEALSGTTSLPFPPCKHRCVAVKVIDPRGNEVMTVQQL